jgi:NADH-quinone oxidoreductase subunit E
MNTTSQNDSTGGGSPVTGGTGILLKLGTRPEPYQLFVRERLETDAKEIIGRYPRATSPAPASSSAPSNSA